VGTRSELLGKHAGEREREKQSERTEGTPVNSRSFVQNMASNSDDADASVRSGWCGVCRRCIIYSSTLTRRINVKSFEAAAAALLSARRRLQLTHRCLSHRINIRVTELSCVSRVVIALKLVMCCPVGSSRPLRPPRKAPQARHPSAVQSVSSSLGHII
jgi:hypothetical protein